MAVTPRGGYFGVLAGVVVAAAVSFGVAAALLGFGRGRDAPRTTPTGDEELAEAQERSAQNKADSKLAPQAT